MKKTDFKQLGYTLGLMNKRVGNNTTAEEVAKNMFTEDTKAYKEFVLYYALGEQAFEVLQ